MKKIFVTLSGGSAENWYSNGYTIQANIAGSNYACKVGKYNFMICNVHGSKGLKIIKQCAWKKITGVKKIQEIISIHKIFHKEGIGPKVDDEIVEIEFDSSSVEQFLPNIPMPINHKDKRWYGFWIETLKPESTSFLDWYIRLENKLSELLKAVDVWHMPVNPAQVINWLVRRSRLKDFCKFVETVKIVCIRNEIFRDAHNSVGTQTAINEFLNRQNVFCTDGGFKIVDVDVGNGFGPIVLEKSDLVKTISEGAQFPVKKRPTQYQGIRVGNIDLLGGRSASVERLHKMGFPFEMFDGATVLDIGCNIGAFCFDANRNRAKLTVGVDGNDEAIEAAKRLRDYAGAKNMVFITHQLNQDLFVDITNVSLEVLLRGVVKEVNFDIVFALSILNHMRNKKLALQLLFNNTKKLLVLEGHANQSEELYRLYLRKYTKFSSVEFKGYSSDRNKRPLFFCWK